MPEQTPSNRECGQFCEASASNAMLDFHKRWRLFFDDFAATIVKTSKMPIGMSEVFLCLQCRDKDGAQTPGSKVQYVWLPAASQRSGPLEPTQTYLAMEDLGGETFGPRHQSRIAFKCGPLVDEFCKVAGFDENSCGPTFEDDLFIHGSHDRR